MARHTTEARKTARQLNELLAAVSEQAGIELAWDATELEVIGLIMAAIDRKVGLTDDYAAATEAKTKVKLAGELRLTETHIARLLKQIKPSAPQPVSKRSSKARAAANARWSKAVV
jgi:hypothetical protein